MANKNKSAPAKRASKQAKKSNHATRGKGVDKYGFMLGSSRAWVAKHCYGIPGGATTAQVVAMLDKQVAAGVFPRSYPHLNMFKPIEKSKLWDKATTMVAGPSGRTVTKYAIVARAK